MSRAGPAEGGRAKSSRHDAHGRQGCEKTPAHAVCRHAQCQSSRAHQAGLIRSIQDVPAARQARGQCVHHRLPQGTGRALSGRHPRHVAGGSTGASAQWQGLPRGPHLCSRSAVKPKLHCLPRCLTCSCPPPAPTRPLASAASPAEQAARHGWCTQAHHRAGSDCGIRSWAQQGAGIISRALRTL